MKVPQPAHVRLHTARRGDACFVLVATIGLQTDQQPILRYATRRLSHRPSSCAYPTRALPGTSNPHVDRCRAPVASSDRNRNDMAVTCCKLCATRDLAQGVPGTGPFNPTCCADPSTARLTSDMPDFARAPKQL